MDEKIDSNMKYYTDHIPLSLAEKLKEKGMPMKSWQGWTTPYISVMENSAYDWLNDDLGILEPQMVERRYSIPTFGACFDWLMSDRRITIVVEPSFYEPYLGKVYSKDGFVKGFDGKTWHEAAEAAIEKALTLI